LRGAPKLQDCFPDHSFPTAISTKLNQLIPLVSIEAFYCVAQSSLNVQFGRRRQWVVDSGWPPLLLENAKDLLLVGRGPFELLHHAVFKKENTPLEIPIRSRA